MGTYEDITASGFNIADILDSFNQASKDKGEKANKFKSEAASPSKILDAEKSEAKKSESEKKKLENLETQDGSTGKKKAEVEMIAPEIKHEGGIKLQDFVDLFSFSIGNFGIFLYCLFSITCAVLQLVPSYVLAEWSDLPLEEQQAQSHWMWWFVGSTVAFMVFVFARSLLMQ